MPIIENMKSFIFYFILCPRLSISDNLLISIREKLKWADTMSEVDRKHRKDVEERVEDVKKTLFHKVS